MSKVNENEPSVCHIMVMERTVFRSTATGLKAE
jgi:hypothetical protein